MFAADESDEAIEDYEPIEDYDGEPSKASFMLVFFPILAAVFGTLFIVDKWHGEYVETTLKGVTRPYYWSSAAGYDLFPILLVTVVVLLGLAFRRERLWFKLTAGGMLLWMLAMILWIGSGAYFTIVGTQVTLFSASPWRLPVTFDLREATIVERGCYHRGGRHGGDTARFKVRDPATGTILNLASGMNAYRAEPWMRIMQPYVAGEIVMEDGKDTDRDPGCLSAKAQLLEPETRAQMSRLLKTKDVVRMSW